jgi:hypothetical protein
MRVLTLRESNRATLARQLLLERVRLDVPAAVHLEPDATSYEVVLTGDPPPGRTGP